MSRCVCHAHIKWENRSHGACTLVAECQLHRVTYAHQVGEPFTWCLYACCMLSTSSCHICTHQMGKPFEVVAIIVNQEEKNARRRKARVYSATERVGGVQREQARTATCNPSAMQSCTRHRRNYALLALVNSKSMQSCPCMRCVPLCPSDHYPVQCSTAWTHH